MNKNTHIHISSEPLSIDEAYGFVLDESCGGNCLFIGTARNHNKGEKVTHLDFETYESMAIKELEKIAERCLEQFDIQKIRIDHRKGEVGLKDIAVIIAVSAVHRKAAFEACEYAIDELKKSVPIWKKEYLESGAHWVSDRP
jgi:molybdopterin synthase catalytic subunit